MGDPLGSAQEMDKTVQPKAKANNTSVCRVLGHYRMVSEQYTGRKWMDIPASRGESPGRVPAGRPLWRPGGGWNAQRVAQPFRRRRESLDKKVSSLPSVVLDLCNGSMRTSIL